MKVNRVFSVQRGLPRLLIVLILLALVVLGAFVSPPVAWGAVGRAKIVDEGHGCGPNQKWDPVDEECVPGTVVDCGKNPYRWNGIGKHYERPFSMYCEPFTGDPNETKYDGKVCSETPMAWWPCERPW